MLRARSLRTALFSTALLTAVAVPAAAAPAPAPAAAPAAAAPTVLAKCKATHKGYGLRAGRKRASSVALGQLTWAKCGSAWTLRNKGFVLDNGKGHGHVTFKAFGRGTVVVKRFKVDDRAKSSSFKLSGHYRKVVITDCKVFRSKDRHCTTRTVQGPRRH